MPTRTDPKYVRLCNRLAESGCLADVSGPSDFFIGGMDVQPFPSDDYPDHQRFVRNKLREGLLEPATRNEHSVVVDASKEMREMHLDMLDEHEAHERAGHQEATIMAKARKTQRELEHLRNVNPDDVSDVDEDQYTSVDQAKTEPAVAQAKSRRQVKDEAPQ